MAGLVFSAVALGVLYFRRCTFGALFLSGFVLLFLSAISASWVAATVAICLFLSAVAPPLIESDPKRRTKFLGIIVSAGMLLACIPAGQRAWKRIQLRDQYEFEKRGLDKLVGGEAIYELIGNKVHMLGSLLNSESCTACHPGPSNQLLGAFSYELEYMTEPTNETLLTRSVVP